MGGSKSSPAPPPPEPAGQTYGEFMSDYAAAAGQRQQAELGDVQTQLKVAAQTIPGLLALQQQYGPEIARQALQSDLAVADEVSAAQRKAVERDLANVNALSPALRAAVIDPQQAAIQAALGKQIEEELNMGATLDPSLRREVEQGVRAGQTARGMSRGQGAVSGEALFKGMQAEQLRRNRQQAADSFIKTTAATSPDVWSAITGKAPVGQLSQFQAQMPANYAGASQFGQQLIPADINAKSNYATQLYNYNSAKASQGGGLLGSGMQGALIGGLLAAPTGGLSIATGAGLGALGGAGLGAAQGQRSW